MQKNFVSFAIALLAGLFGWLPDASSQEKRFALLIGNQAYDTSVGVLKNPHNDVMIVANALKHQGFEILPIIKDARRSTILGAVRDLVRHLNTSGAGAVGFLYYSGHGAAEKDTNINYLIPVDAKDPGSTAFWDESLKLDDIMRLLDGARGAVKFVVFDACRNELQLPTRDTSKGLLPVAEQQGFFVAYASAPGRTASDRGAASGPYAAALAKELNRRGLDHLNLFQNVKESVIASTSGSQHPWESNGLTRRIYLTGEPTMPAEIALWEKVRSSADTAALQDFISKFPDGVFAGTAAQMIERLKSEAAQQEANRKFEAQRKAQEAKQQAELKLALDEARMAREAVDKAEARRAAAEKAALENRTPAGSAIDSEAKATREALAAAELRRQDAETRLVALEKAETDRKKALALLAETDQAAAKRAAISLEALQKAQQEQMNVREIRLGHFFSLNDQCKVLRPPTVEVIKPPAFGTIRIKEGEATATTIFARNRQHCKGTKGPARIAYYILDPKFDGKSGTDIVALRARHASGVQDSSEYEIDLTQRVSTRTKFARQQ